MAFKNPLLRWYLVSIDPAVSILIKGKYPPNDGVTIDRQANLSSSSTPGTVAPAVQWISNKERTVSFSSIITSDHCFDNIQPLFETFQRLNVRDAVLGRAPKVDFLWKDVSARGYVSQLNLRVVGYWATGFMRAFAFDLQITDAPDLRLDLSSPTPGETQYLTLGAGETFEWLALHHFGDPLLGELIRRENPELASSRETAGDVVRILEADHPRMREEVEPVSLPFLGTGWQSTMQTLATSRGTSSDYGLTWDLLPEVINEELDY